MPIKSYSVLKGRVAAVLPGNNHSPHYQIKVAAGSEQYRIAVNILSKDRRYVEFLAHSQFDHPILARLPALGMGLTPIPSAPNGIALDYIRGNLAQPSEFVPLPPDTPGSANDLNSKVGLYAQRAMQDPEALIYAFGSAWGPDQEEDPYFHFLPGRGIHDIHMNQGNPPEEEGQDNGVWQDGGLIFAFPAQAQHAAIFLKFQSQAWHTDDTTGEPLEPAEGVEAPPRFARAPRVPFGAVADGRVRIVAALINAEDAKPAQTVTILNTTDATIDLAGWQIADSSKNKMGLKGTLPAGEASRITLQAQVQLLREGGIITLLDQSGRKVHGVAYTAEQAARAGWTIAFAM